MPHSNLLGQLITKIILTLLVCAVFVSALHLVVVRHENRNLFIELQELQQQRDALNISYGQLQLEISTLAQHNRIETIAQKQLNMITPTAQNIIVIKP
ncbi:cell division protein [Beggiatoa sp. PS]|nr:cell division protein [Beggiatoa sp. PS]